MAFIPPPNPYPAPPITANEELKDHTKLFKKQIYSVENVHNFVGFNISNITIVVTNNKTLCVIDTGLNMQHMTETWTAFQSAPSIEAEVKGYPVEAVILTHHHGDHVNGTRFLLEKFPTLVIYGADNLHAEHSQENGLIAPLGVSRSLAMFNTFILQAHPEEIAGLNCGCGTLMTVSPALGYVPPKVLFSTSEPFSVQSVTIGGLELQVMHVPGEAKSEIALYIPSRHVLLGTDNIYHGFPNLYTLRGANYREPLDWAKSIDAFIEKFGDAKHLVLQHGPPIIYNPETSSTDPNYFVLSEIFTRYRDAIQLVRDQTLRWAMQGYSKEEIMHLVHLPHAQASFSPWLREFYGKVQHCVPAVYDGYIGWFDGDPIALNPTPRSQMASRLVQSMGGEKAVLEQAHNAYTKGNELIAKNLLEEAKFEWQYAAELVTYIIRMKSNTNAQQTTAVSDAQREEKVHKHFHGIPKQLLHTEPTESDPTWWHARYLKAACFRQLGYREISANWVGTYLTAAHELEGEPLLGTLYNRMRHVYTNVGIPLDVPTLLESLAIRVRSEVAEKIEPQKSVIHLQVEGQAVVYRLQLRNSVLISCKLDSVPPEAILIQAPIVTIKKLLSGDGGFNAILTNDTVKITPPSGLDAATHFFSFFIAGIFSKAPNIYVH